MPVYYLALLLFSLGTDWSWGDFGLNVLFLSQIFDAPTIIPVGWSMEVMVQVYVLLPITILAIERIGRRWTWAILVGLIALSLLPRLVLLIASPEAVEQTLDQLIAGTTAHPAHEVLYLFTLYRLTPFLLGLLLAYLWHFETARLTSIFSRTSAQAVAVISGLTLMYFGGALPLHTPEGWVYAGPLAFNDAAWTVYWTIHRLLFAAGLSLILLAMSFGPVWRPVAYVLRWHVWDVISRNIFPIYLFHFIGIILSVALVFLLSDYALLDALLTGNDEVAQRKILEVTVWQIFAIFAIAFALSLGLAMMIGRWIERPVQGFIRRRFDAWRAAGRGA